MTLRLTRFLVTLGLATVATGHAFAQSTATFADTPPEPAAPPAANVAPAAPTQPPAVAVAERSAWDARFNAARALLESGDFARSASEFGLLTQTAPTPFDATRARDLGQLAYTWAQRGVTLVERKALIGSDIEAKHEDHRTADEIGVLYTTSVLYGLGTGLWIDVLAQPKDFSGTLILTPLLFGGAAAGGVALLDSGRGLRYGAAQSIASGMYIGLWQGIAWTTYIQATTSYAKQLSGEQYATALWASATAGALVGGVVGTQSSTTPGRAAYVSSASLWPAFILGFGIAGISEDNSYRDDHALLAASIGATGGAVAGVLSAGPVSPTTARVRFLDLGGLSGALLGGGLYLAATSDNADLGTFSVLTALGTAAGLGVAWATTTGMPRDEGATAKRTSFELHPQMLSVPKGAALGFAGVF